MGSNAIPAGATTIRETAVGQHHTFILHASRAEGGFPTEFFEPAWWREHGAEVGAAAGRGTVRFVRAPGGVWVLRHYLRGGFIASISRDRYVWTGLERTRPWREWRLLYLLHERGLPVPQPVAARVVRNGWSYRGDLITRCIEGARTLAELLRTGSVPVDHWQAVGRLVRRLHDAAVRHGDINVRNILQDAAGAFHLIDFDRARFGGAARGWRDANIARFFRSIAKLQRKEPGIAFGSGDWAAFLLGYGGGEPQPSALAWKKLSARYPAHS